MRVLGLSGLVLLAACSEVPVANAVAGDPQAQAGTVIETEAGKYRVEIDPKLDSKALPVNADLKMVDNDIAQYAVKLCGLDFKNKLRPERCEVFVQSDPSGLLVGYAILQQRDTVRIDTEVRTDAKRSGLGCFVGGVLENTDFDHPDAKLDISKNFESRLPYFVWEKEPGNYMVSPTDSEEYNVGGMWYVKRQNNKLRISQERWSYCYRDTKVFIDEVFSRAVTLSLAED